MEYSGNSFKDAMDKQRELDEKAIGKSLFVCPVCKKKTDESNWHWGYECCIDPCFLEHAEEAEYKHREERNKNETD